MATDPKILDGYCDLLFILVILHNILNDVCCVFVSYKMTIQLNAGGLIKP